MKNMYDFDYFFKQARELGLSQEDAIVHADVQCELYGIGNTHKKTKELFIKVLNECWGLNRAMEESQHYGLALLIEDGRVTGYTYE